MKFYRARFESSNFTFEAYAHTKEQALKVLKKGLTLHTKQYDLSRGWYEADEINVEELKFGVPYRDYDTMEDE